MLSLFLITRYQFTRSDFDGGVPGVKRTRQSHSGHLIDSDCWVSVLDRGVGEEGGGRGGGYSVHVP